MQQPDHDDDDDDEYYTAHLYFHRGMPWFEKVVMHNRIEELTIGYDRNCKPETNSGRITSRHDETKTEAVVLVPAKLCIDFVQDYAQLVVADESRLQQQFSTPVLTNLSTNLLFLGCMGCESDQQEKREVLVKLIRVTLRDELLRRKNAIKDAPDQFLAFVSSCHSSGAGDIMMPMDLIEMVALEMARILSY